MEVNVDAKHLLNKVKQIKHDLRRLAAEEDDKWKPDGFNEKQIVLGVLQQLAWCCYNAQDYVVRFGDSEITVLEGCERLLWAGET